MRYRIFRNSAGISFDSDVPFKIDQTPAPQISSPMIMTVDTNYGATTLFGWDGLLNFVIDWGDGNTETVNINGYYETEHTYTGSLGEKTITVTGSAQYFYGEYNNNWTGITDWGNIGLESVSNAFGGMTHINTVANNLPPTLTDISYLFSQNYYNNVSLANLDVSNVTNFQGLFLNSNAFNVDISGWNVSNATNMNDMFYNATIFAQDLSGWCVTNIPTEPTDFSTGAGPLTPPVWGTCP